MMFKHTYKDNKRINDDDEEEEDSSSSSGSSSDDEPLGYVKEMHCSQQHIDELLQRQRPPMHESTLLPRPANLTEYFIYYFNRFTDKKKMKPSGYWRYLLGVYKNLFLAFYFNWVVIFTSPLSSLAFVFIYPIISILLFIFEIGLKLFMDGLGGAQLVKRISHDFGKGFSAINWGAPQLLLSDKSKQLIKSTLHSLGNENHILEDDDHRHRTYDISIGQTMVILSSLVYERHDELVTNAYKLLNRFNENRKGKTLEQVENEMKDLIWKSEKPIRKIARTYGLHFAGVTELKSLGGPFCGLFWSMNPNDSFIIVAFKGTTPTNYSEFLVDATLQRTDARSYLFGAAHEGFYDSLFSTQSDADDSRDPYFAIRNAVKQKAKQIQETSHRKVQVWITGHSLGAAMGALLFARWLKCPEDIDPHCTVRDAYVVGLPAVGDNDFASIFASYSNTPLSRSCTLWRTINKSDIICRLPPGYNNITIGHYIPQGDFFNYSHVGHAVQITHPMLSPTPLKIYPSSYQSNVNVDVIVSDTACKENHIDDKLQVEQDEVTPTDIQNYPWWIRPWIKRVVNPIPIIESFYPFFLKDHIPIHYFEGLERARSHFSKKQ